MSDAPESRRPTPRISVFTLFPELIATHASTSLLGRARAAGVLDVHAHDLRRFGVGVHQSVDDAPFGGGAGMVLAPGPVFDAVETAIAEGVAARPVLLLGPGGRRLTQSVARELATVLVERGGFSLLCGRYEGFDQRIHDHLVDGELSIGDVVLGGGEVAAMAVAEAVGRLIPGVMGNDQSAIVESFADGLLEHPQYTRPAEFRGWSVPDVLRSGDHARVARWRHAQALARTAALRPDLFAERGSLTPIEIRSLAEFGIDLTGGTLRADEGASTE
jgi:tRNA (guanine37-N1)-methyltransferase